MSFFLAFYLLTGIIAGFLAGLFGIGGGLIIVPLFILALGFIPETSEFAVHVAVGSSLTVICFTAAASAWQHWRQNEVEWADVLWLTPALIGGAALGAFVADRLGGDALSMAIGVFAVLTAFQMSLGLQPRTPTHISGRYMLPAGVMIGAASTLFGSGGGSLTLPFLHWMGRGMHKAIGTSSVCALPIAITGAFTFALTGQDNPIVLPTVVENLGYWPSFMPQITGYIYWPAVLPVVLMGMPAARLGAITAQRLPATLLLRAFVSYLILVGLFLISRSAGFL